METTPTAPTTPSSKPKEPIKAIIGRWLLTALRFLLGRGGPPILGFVAAVLLARSFEATESDWVVVYGTTNEPYQGVPGNYQGAFTALCVKGKIVAFDYVDQPTTNDLSAGPCPPGEQFPVAQIARDSKALFVLGWLALVASVIWQLFQLIWPKTQDA